MANPMVEISWGELVDRISILQLKKKHVRSDEVRAYLHTEISDLELILDQIDRSEIQTHCTNLQDINQKLWNVEDDLREAERNGDFGERFVELARSVYKLNDQRSAEKGYINDVLKSALREVKVFSGEAD